MRHQVSSSAAPKLYKMAIKPSLPPCFKQTLNNQPLYFLTKMNNEALLCNIYTVYSPFFAQVAGN
jgi:hypothetical protein